MLRPNLQYLDMKMSDCPLCGGKTFTSLFDGDRYFMGLKTVGCNECGFIQTNPRPSAAGLSNFYRDDYRKFYQGVVSPSEKYIYDNNKKERLKQSAQFLMSSIQMSSSDSSMVDVGCSEGAFFNALLKEGFNGDMYGVELNPEFRRYAELNSPAKVYGSAAELAAKVRLITLNHVLEHVFDPKQYLFELQSKLDVGGYIYIDVPDAEEYSTILDFHIGHIYHFTTKSLQYLLGLTGFSVVKCEKYSPISHPKSIRIIAQKGEALPVPERPGSVTDTSAWDAVRNVSYVKEKLFYFARKIPFLKKVYNVFLLR